MAWTWSQAVSTIAYASNPRTGRTTCTGCYYCNRRMWAATSLSQLPLAPLMCLATCLSMIVLRDSCCHLQRSFRHLLPNIQYNHFHHGWCWQPWTLNVIDLVCTLVACCPNSVVLCLFLLMPSVTLISRHFKRRLKKWWYSVPKFHPAVSYRIVLSISISTHIWLADPYRQRTQVCRAVFVKRDRVLTTVT